MNKDERLALAIVQGSMEMLRNAIIRGDPQPELELRARDLLAEIAGIRNGNARTVASFGRGSK